MIDPSAAYSFASVMCGEHETVDAEASEDDDAFVEALHRFQRAGKHNEELLNVVLRTGSVALMLQSPSAHKRMSAHLAALAAESSPHVLATVRRVRDPGRHTHHGHMPVAA